MFNSISIRSFKDNDLDEILELFYETVHTINSKDYSLEQVNAWAEKEPDKEKFLKLFHDHYSFIIENNEESNKILGFADMSSDGYLNCFYIHKDYQNLGLGKRLLNEIIAKAKELKLEVVTTESSISSKGFFEKLGFECVSAQTRIISSIEFINYIMKKFIGDRVSQEVEE